MTTNESPVTDRLDVRIRDIARLALTGETTEVEARWAIAAALSEAEIPAYVARSANGISPQMRDDLAERLTKLIITKTIQETDGGLDLKKLESVSASGWARSLARAGVQSSLRDIRRVTTDHNVFIDPLDNERGEESRFVTGSHADFVFHTASVEFSTDLDDIDEEDEINDIGADFNEAAAGLRPSGRLRLAATALYAASHLPAVVRPNTAGDREWVRQAITDDPALVQRSVASMHALIVARQSPEQLLVDTRLLALWDDYSPADLEKLVERPAKFAYLVVLAAVSPLPRPSRDAIALALRTMRMADEGSNWKTLTRELLDAWIATEAEAFSEFDTKGAQDAERAADRMAAAMNWPALVSEMAARKGAPLGSTEHEVSQWISSTFQVMK